MKLHDIHYLILKLNCKAIIFKIVHNDKNTDQWNEIKSLKISAYIYDLLILNKGAKTVAWQKDSLWFLFF